MPCEKGSNMFFFLAFLLSIAVQYGNGQGAQPIRYSVEEEQRPGTLLGNLISDANMDQTIGFEEAKGLQFRITSRDNLEYITVEEDTGNVKVKSRIDREEICPLLDICQLKYDVVVSPARYFRIIKILINIEDLNDHAPIFLDSEYSLHIPESTLPGTTFPLPAAKDLDGGINGIQEQELDSTTGIFRLQIREITNGRYDLRLQVLEYLDRERRDRYTLQIKARDGGNPPQEGTLNVVVIVEDSNDNDPHFDSLSYDVDIPEDVAVGTTITKVQATDRDIGQNGRIRYSFSSQTRDDYGSVFGINDHTGDIYVRGPLDFEYRSLYVLTVEAHDRGEGALSSQTNVNVHIQDVNDKPPSVSINAISESGLPEIMEHVPAGTFVAHLSVTDNDQGDGGRYNCLIRSDDFELRRIASDQYNIHSKRVFDRELEERFDVAVICTDYGNPPLTSITQMEVRIADANDQAPRFPSDVIRKSVMENIPPGAVFMQVNATDSDIGRNSRIVYNLGGTDSSLLSIDSRTGEISTKVLLDHEQKNELDFIVYAEDRGDPVLSSSATVHVEIKDEDDEFPRFEQQQYSFTIDENKPPGTYVGTIIAHDADSFPYNDFVYAFTPILNAVTQFAIDPHTGMITSKAYLDRESTSVFTLIATVSPTGNPVQTSECRILIHVRDLNDNRPVFQFPLIGFNDTVQLNSHSPAGQTVARLRAHDPDLNLNSDLMYAIIGGNDGSTFSIDTSSGDILLYRDVSNLSDRRYRLTVEVKDKGEPQLSDVSTLYIVIINSTVELPVVKESSSILQSETLTLLLAVTAGLLLVLIVLIISVLIICRSRRKRDAKRYEEDSKECQKMLSYNGSSVEQSPVANGNGVTVIDMTNEKVCKPLLMNRGSEEKTPLTVDLLSNHPIVKQNGASHQNGHIVNGTKLSTFASSPRTASPSSPKHFPSNHDISRVRSPAFDSPGSLKNGHGLVHNGTLHNNYDSSSLNRAKHSKATVPPRTSALSGEYVRYDVVDSNV